MDGVLVKGRSGWQVETCFPLPDGRELSFSTSKRHDGSLVIDTHGADVIDPVWQLLDTTYELLGVHPTCLERDFNIPPLTGLLPEVERIASIQARHSCKPAQAA